MIRSVSNPLVKELVRLRSRRHRDRSHRFLIEGSRPVSMAVAAGVPIIDLILSPELGGHGSVPGLQPIEMANEPFRKISMRENPDGVLAVAGHLRLELDRIEPGPSPLVLVVESVEKPGNLGGMLRTADAVGADAVVVADPTTDVHNPNVIRASQGALFTVPLAVATASEVVAWLEQKGIGMVATTPGSDVRLWDVDLTRPTAVVVGAEASGLTDTFLSQAVAVQIPMSGTVDSLNASVAAAVTLYEAARQRAQA